MRLRLMSGTCSRPPQAFRKAWSAGHDPLAALPAAVARAARPLAAAQPESDPRADHSGRRPRHRWRIGLDGAGATEAPPPAPRSDPRAVLPRSLDRKSAVSGKRVSVRVSRGGRRTFKKK